MGCAGDTSAGRLQVANLRNDEGVLGMRRLLAAVLGVGLVASVLPGCLVTKQERTVETENGPVEKKSVTVTPSLHPGYEKKEGPEASRTD